MLCGRRHAYERHIDRLVVVIRLAVYCLHAQPVDASASPVRVGRFHH